MENQQSAFSAATLLSIHHFLMFRNTYVNHWEVESKIVSVEDGAQGGSSILRQHIWNAVRETIQEWTGQQLQECSLYGVRIYEEGAILATRTLKR